MLSRGNLIFGPLFLIQGLGFLPPPQHFKEKYLQAGLIHVSRHAARFSLIQIVQDQALTPFLNESSEFRGSTGSCPSAH